MYIQGLREALDEVVKTRLCHRCHVGVLEFKTIKENNIWFKCSNIECGYEYIKEYIK